MTDFDIVNNYMEKKYSGNTYVIREGNKCVWVSMGRLEMYFILRNSVIIDIQVD